MNRPSFVTWRPATIYVFVAGLVAVAVGLFAVYRIDAHASTVPVRLAGGTYNVWVADTDAALKKGLSGVMGLKSGEGLLMIFDHDDTWRIWMKDMKIPLDIVWLNKDKQVVHIVKDARPELSTSVVFTPPTSARYVLELPSGEVERADIKDNDRATFSSPSNEGL